LRKALDCGGDRIRQAAKDDDAFECLRPRRSFRELINASSSSPTVQGRWRVRLWATRLLAILIITVSFASVLFRPVAERLAWSFSPRIEALHQFELRMAAYLDRWWPSRDANGSQPVAPPGHAQHPQYEARRWTDRTGNRSALARFREFRDGEVVLVRDDGAPVRCSWDDLDAEDQDYVRSVIGPGLDREIKRFRIWSDQSGKQTARAAFIRGEQNTVVVEREDGTRANIDLTTMSIDDREYVDAVLGSD
jgi:hypothetical protein